MSSIILNMRMTHPHVEAWAWPARHDSDDRSWPWIALGAKAEATAAATSAAIKGSTASQKTLWIHSVFEDDCQKHFEFIGILKMMIKNNLNS
jgi:hypothetical protein